MIVGEYYRSSDGAVHLAPCPSMSDDAAPVFDGDMLSLHETVRTVVSRPQDRLCGDCWPTSAHTYAAQLDTA